MAQGRDEQDEGGEIAQLPRSLPIGRGGRISPKASGCDHLCRVGGQEGVPDSARG